MISTPIAFGQFTEYRDTENGFSIKYPTSWVATEESSHDGKWSQFFFASELKQGEGIPNLSVSYFTDFFTNDNFFTYPPILNFLSGAILFSNNSVGV